MKKDCLRSDPIKAEKCHFGVVLIFIISFSEVKHLLFRNLIHSYVFRKRSDKITHRNPPQVWRDLLVRKPKFLAVDKCGQILALR